MQPVIKFFKEDGSELNDSNTWQLGECDAGSTVGDKDKQFNDETNNPNHEFVPLRVYMWNNKGESNDALARSTARNIVLTVTDKEGQYSGPVVTQHWVNVCVNPNDSLEENQKVYVPIGGGDAQYQAKVNAIGINPEDIDEDTNEAYGYCIKGGTNSGASSDTENYAVLDFKVVIPPNATEGAKPFRVLARYSYT